MRRVAGVLVALALTGCGGAKPPGERTERLVPADTVAYLHLSTDPGREQDAQVYRRLARFPVIARLERRLGVRAADVRPWLGREAAVALTKRGTLVLLRVGDRRKAQAFADRTGGVFTHGFLAIGPDALTGAVGTGASLADNPDFRRALRGRPADRVLEAWARGDARSALGSLAARVPDVTAGLTAAPVDGGIRIRVRVLGAGTRDFAPKLLEGAPEDAVAYVGLRSLAPLTGLLPAQGRPLADALAPVSSQPEVALAVKPADPDPVVTLSARAADAAAARTALGALQERLTSLLTGSEDDTGQVPTFDEVDLGGGLSAFALRLAGGGELVSGLKGARIAVSNAEAGVQRALSPHGDGLEDTDRFKRAVTDVPGRSEVLGFIDLSQLLALAERAGLTGSRAYEAARGDLREIRTLGLVVRRQGTDTTAELVLHTK